MLEELILDGLDNLEAVCHGPIPMGSFGNLRILRLRSCKRLKYVFSLPAQHGRESAFPQLQHLELSDLPELISFYSTRSSGTQESMTVFSQQVALPGLESLSVRGLDNIRALWPDQLPTNSFSKLRKLQVMGCKKLLNHFPVSVASALVQLEDLNISQSGVEAIVHNENEDEAAPLLLFPNLTSLTLSGLHQLKRFCSRRFSSSWPLLKELEVLYCDKVEILFQQINSECELEPLFWVEQVALPGLESLSVRGLDNIRALWPDQLPTNSFSKLRKLQVMGCKKLLNHFPVSVASALVQLEDLNISQSGVEAIVHNENEDEAAPLLLFPNLTSLTLSGLHQLKRFCSRRFSSSWPLLKELEVLYCDKVEILFQQINSECELEPLFWVEQVALPGLESLSVRGLDNIRALWPDQLPANSFSKLRKLQVMGCKKLLNHFPVSVASALVQLEDLNISQSGVEAIVHNENEDEAAPLLLFPNLTSLTLSGLHQLKRFCSRRFSSSWPLLKELEVLYCDKVEILFQQINSECELEPLFWVEQVALPGLESLSVRGLDNIRALWPDQLPTNSFSKLRKLQVMGCKKLLNHFPVSVASALVQLEDLNISQSGVEAIVHNENEDEAAPLLLFPNLTSLTLSGLHQLKRFCSRRFSSSWPLLKELEVLYCDKVEILFQQINSECELEPLFWVEQVALPGLESLSVRGLDNIRALWPDQLPANSFSKLRKLQVMGCKKLLNHFPVSVASALVQLEDLNISQSGVEAIVHNENEDEAAPLLLFPNLTSLTLSGLHQLKRFCSRRFSSSWPLLKELEVLYCDKVEILFQQINSECELEPLFWVEQVALQGLESLSVRGLDNIRALWSDQLPANSFSKLRKLQVRGCNKLLNLFLVSVASALVQLEDLYISKSGVEAIVANENEDEAAPLLLFPNLTSLTLSGLHQLKRFCSKRFSSSWPLLKELKVLDCDKVEILFQEINSECELEPLFWVEQVALPGLESFSVGGLDCKTL
ncbi:uncharacterized protein LOC132252616 isoform X1 [Vitis vinifera]|uniref:uncharacterized protein LOC132252616 isoform X1 n=1 Tax=Vitis vinifera TaxID=29760 RepID=UPI00288341D4|nr:uncharacterized protein LOC132252616 isoform X1 [Vitis vinifera]